VFSGKITPNPPSLTDIPLFINNFALINIINEKKTKKYLEYVCNFVKILNYYNIKIISSI